MRERLARLISNTLNPFVISAVIIILLSFKETSSVTDAIRWAALSLAMSVLPIFIIVIYLIHRKKLEGFFNNPRRQRNVVYILASVFGAIGCGLLWYLNAPEVLAVTFTAGLISIVLFMGINYLWKISLHTAFAAASLTILIIVYGVVATWTLVFLPLVAWGRIELRQHSIMQVAGGAVLAVLIVVGVFWGFGVIWS